MCSFTDQLITRLSESVSGTPLQDLPSVLDILFSIYQDLYPTDPECIQTGFSHLNDILSKLTLRECDKVWDLTCQLCTDHARFAFRVGVQVGAKLIQELSE